ncbi:MAG: DUF996 domain-containing protein [Nitrososphaerota archaeon]|nr:DUF996 domain-containing protein [Nitrososphaerota archaeon]
MGDFATSKLLAGLGSILLFIPGLNIVGIIFILLGMKGLANHYRDNRIYRNAIIGTIFGIIGLISISISMISVLITVFSHSASLTGSYGSTAATTVNYMPNALTMLIAFIFISLMALFFRKAFHTLSACSGLRLFRVVGILLFIGAIVPVLSISLAAVLEIVSRSYVSTSYNTHVLLMNTDMLLVVLGLFVGLLLVYITFILLVVAFFSLKPVQHLNAPTTNAETKCCTHCGALISLGNSFCSHCGKQHKEK